MDPADNFNLGGHSRSISTKSAEAQYWFNIGLNWCFAFNKAEGVKCFKKALEFDPECVMAHWGMAYGSGPFYNLTWRDLGEKEAAAATKVAFEHVQIALGLLNCSSGLEGRLVRAQAVRIQGPHPVPGQEYDRWDDDYASEMRRVYHEHPEDPDVAALFIEALMMRTPRRLWDIKTGLPQKGSDVLEALHTSESAIKASEASGKYHPAILHLHIHLLEMSNFPERALASAKILGTLCPDAGHFNHMPGHIYMLLGDYESTVVASDKAIAVNDVYLSYAGLLTPYTTPCAHDLLLKMHACMFMGRYHEALATSNKLRSLASKEVLSLADRPKFTSSLEGYYSMGTHVLVRFGRWHDIISASFPEDPDLYPVSTAMQYYARGVAYAALKESSKAEEERKLFHKSVVRIPATRKIFNNTAHAVLGVGEKMLDGELAFHKGNFEEAYSHLREAVRRDDNLEYVEPWAWMHPPRHALGALLAERGYLEEAEQVYRDDLGLSGRIPRCAQHLDNVWALHGLAECIKSRGTSDELLVVERKLDQALKLADVPISSSCMCRSSKDGSGKREADCCTKH